MTEKHSKRTPKLYHRLFGRHVPKELLVPVNQYDIVRDQIKRKAVEPLRPAVEAQVRQRQQLLRQFLGLPTDASDGEALSALTQALFDGFTVVEGGNPRYRHAEVVQIFAQLALKREIKAACEAVAKRARKSGRPRSWNAVRRDFYGSGECRARTGGYLDPSEYALVHSGILAPLYGYGRQHPKTVCVHYLEAADYGPTAGQLFFALQGAELCQARGLSPEAHRDLTGEGKEGVDVVVVADPATGAILKALLDDIGLIVTLFHNEEPFPAGMPVSIFVLKDQIPEGVRKAVDAFLDRRFSQTNPGAFDPLLARVQKEG